MTTLSKKRSPLLRFLDKTIGDHFIVPTERLIKVAILGIFVTLVGYFFGIGLQAFILFQVLIIVLSVIDLVLLPKRSQLKASRQLPEQVDVHEPLTMTVNVINESGQPLTIEFRDDVPLTFAKEEPHMIYKLTKKEQQLSYALCAHERGRYVFSFIHLRYSGVLGLWKKQTKIDVTDEIKVYPDLSNVRSYINSPQEQLILEGKKVYRKKQQGSEFHQIREYVPDDDPRFINWSASARTRQLMTNVYQPERGKRITIMLDCGRMMGVELDNQVKLDRTLEAALTLAAVALRQGDQVSLLAFSDKVKAYVPLGKGMTHFHTIVEAVYDLKTDYVEANYQLALHYLNRWQKRSGLTVLFSDMENYLFEEQLEAMLMKQRRRQMLLLLSLKDPLLHQWTLTDVEKSGHAYVKSLAYKFTMDRKKYVQKMASIGIPILDVSADQLPLTVINYYFDLKSRDAL